MNINQPTNINFLAENTYRLTFRRLPNVTFFTQGVVLPSLSIEVAQQVGPFKHIPRPGHKIQYDDFTVEFKVDEDFNNYLEIFNWLNGLGFPEDFNGIKSLGNDGRVSDATLTILTSASNPNIEITFQDMFPFALGTLNFNNAATETKYLTCSASFKYQRFKIAKQST